MADYLLHALVTLFVTLDPLGLAPMFMVLTAGAGPVARRQVAVRASVTAALVLIAFALAGNALLTFLGISLAAFRIAGGLLLFAIAFEMVFERRSERKSVTAEKASSEDLRHLAIFPLAIPLTSGPGAISATILRLRRRAACCSSSG
jgi:multiple antibiotic resistance protein